MPQQTPQTARVPQPQRTPTPGPVELDPSLFALVAGGRSSPRGTWQVAAGEGARQSPRGTW